MTKYLRNFLLIFFITIIFIEITSKFILKINLFKSFNHSYLTFSFTEIDRNNFMNLKKNVSFKRDFEIYTDSNRLRVKDKSFNNQLNSDNPKVLFLGDSVPFGWGVDYNQSIGGYFDEINDDFQIINASVPSYTPKQSITKFENEFSDIKNLKFIYISNFNPLDLYLIFGKKWDEDLNWTNYIHYFSEDLFFFKYKSIPFWDEINFFKILRKVYVAKIFQFSKKKEYERTELSDKNFINYYTDQLNRLKKLNLKNTKIIFTPILTPLNFENNNEILSQIEKDKLKLINRINLNLQKFNSKNFIFLDLVALMKNYKINEVFIDDCCHLSPFGAKKIADHINKIVSINND